MNNQVERPCKHLCPILRNDTSIPSRACEHHEGIQWAGATAPLNLNLVIRRKWAVDFTLQLLQPWVKIPQQLMKRRLSQSQMQSGCFRQEKILYPTQRDWEKSWKPQPIFRVRFQPGYFQMCNRTAIHSTAAFCSYLVKWPAQSPAVVLVLPLFQTLDGITTLHMANQYHM